MAAAREKQRAARAKKQLGREGVKLVQPLSEEKERVREKISVSKRPSALVEGSGQSMGMEID